VEELIVEVVANLRATAKASSVTPPKSETGADPIVLAGRAPAKIGQPPHAGPWPSVCS
jgi:hypothetical protein